MNRTGLPDLAVDGAIGAARTTPASRPVRTCCPQPLPKGAGRNPFVDRRHACGRDSLACHASPQMIVNAYDPGSATIEGHYNRLLEAILVCRRGRHYCNPGVL